MVNFVVFHYTPQFTYCHALNVTSRFFKSGPDLLCLLLSCSLLIVSLTECSVPRLLAISVCRVLVGITLAVTPLQVRSLNPLDSTHQKHAFSTPSTVSAALAQLHLLLLIQIDLPRLALTVSSCVSAINNPLRPILFSHIPTWRLALCPIPALFHVRSCIDPCYFFISYNSSCFSPPELRKY